ncbi:MAG TPA: hypothetical protein VE978_07160 [Chitinophagales bacterium]|nr:hypothetical protein [Chitinophagales bacterium]
MKTKFNFKIFFCSTICCAIISCTKTDDYPAQKWVITFTNSAGNSSPEIIVQTTQFSSAGTTTTFSETDESPGVVEWDNTGTCSYRVNIGGNIFNNASGIMTWEFVGFEGGACNGSTTGTTGDTGTSQGPFSKATFVSGGVEHVVIRVGTSPFNEDWTWTARRIN